MVASHPYVTKLNGITILLYYRGILDLVTLQLCQIIQG